MAMPAATGSAQPNPNAMARSDTCGNPGSSASAIENTTAPAALTTTA